MKLHHLLTHSTAVSNAHTRNRTHNAGTTPGHWIIGLCTLLTCVLTTTAFADWSLLNSGTSADLLAVDFPFDATTGFAVGRNGTILKTTNAGNSWKKQKSRTRKRLSDVAFVTNDIGFVVGDDGKFLKTTNGGTTWTALSTGTTQDLFAVTFPVDANTGYIGGANGTLRKTTDGGQTWVAQNTVQGWVKEIVFPEDSSTGYASTVYGTLGYIYKTTDGGQNWTQVFFLYDAFLDSMSFVDNQLGYVANHDTYTQHGIWQTADGGATWQLVTAGLTSVPVAVDFPDSQTGFAVGFSGALLSTTDGGAHWTEGTLGVSTRLEDVYFVTNSTGYLVGDNGVIAKTTDGGAPAVQIVYMHPTGPGSINTFTDQVGCTDDWDCVNDQGGNLGTGIPDTVHSGSYVADGSGNRAMFALDDGVLSAGQTVSEICVSIAATQFNGPYASLSYQRIGIDASPVDSVAFWIGSYWYNGIKTHCWSNLNWTASALDALEIGVKSVSGKWIQAAQLYATVHVNGP